MKFPPPRVECCIVRGNPSHKQQLGHRFAEALCEKILQRPFCALEETGKILFLEALQTEKILQGTPFYCDLEEI